MAETWRPALALRASAGLHGTAAALTALHPAWWAGAAACVAANHLALGALGLWPRSRALGPNLTRLPGDGIALTFDDGPDPAVTPRVLDLLAAAGARATFFCIGARARQHPALLRRAVAGGHRVENHSMTHPHGFAALAGTRLRREVTDAQALLADITGVAPAWFRAPMGLRSPLLDPVLHEAGLRLASWTRRGFDTRLADPGRVLARLGNVRAGDIVLLHDGNAATGADGRAVVLHVLPRLLAASRQARLTPALLPGGAPAATASRASAAHAST